MTAGMRKFRVRCPSSTALFTAERGGGEKREPRRMMPTEAHNRCGVKRRVGAACARRARSACLRGRSRGCSSFHWSWGRPRTPPAVRGGRTREARFGRRLSSEVKLPDAASDGCLRIRM